MPASGKRERSERVDPRAELDVLEEAIEELRVAYEKYFCGIDKVAPTKKRERVERQLRLFLGSHLTSTALRFRLHGLRARMTTYKHYWTRVEREMERGVYRRDLQRAARRQARHEPEAEAANDNASDAGKQHRAPDRAPLTPEDAGLDSKHLREVFKQLVAAKRRAGESVEGLSYAALVRKLVREAPKLRAKTKGAVCFEVHTVDGRVKLRAKAARSESLMHRTEQAG